MMKFEDGVLLRDAVSKVVADEPFAWAETVNPESPASHFDEAIAGWTSTYVYVVRVDRAHVARLDRYPRHPWRQAVAAPHLPGEPPPRSLMAEAVDRDRLRHVQPRSDRELLVQAIKAAGHDGPRCTRRAAVGAMLGHGSGVSHALCVAAGLDPNELVGAETGEGDEDWTCPTCDASLPECDCGRPGDR